MSSLTVKFSGLDGLVKKMEELGGITANLKVEAIEAMKKPMQAAKRHCPVDSTKLQTNITVKDLTTGKDLRIGMGIFAEATINYAVYVEYGTGLYAENGMGRQTPWVYQRADGEFRSTVGMHPHPFIRPAWDEEKNNVMEDMKKAVVNKIQVLTV